MLKVGVIGLGVGERHIIGFDGTGQAKTHFLCDIDSKRLSEVAHRRNIVNTTTNADDILSHPEIDIVSIASYDQDHAEQVIKALNNDKHVFVEKPLCLNQAELDAIKTANKEALMRGKSLKLSSNFILRKEARFVNLKSRIEAGEIGDIYLIEGCYDYGRVQKLVSGWRAKTPDYSIMHGGGIHLLDLCQWLTGEKFKPKAAIAHKSVTNGTDFAPPDTILSIGNFGDNIIGKIGANFGSQTAHFHQIKVYGSKGTFIHDCANTSYYFGSEPNVTVERDETIFPSSNKGDLIPDFLKAIQKNASLEIDFEHVDQIMQTSIDIDTMALDN